MSVIRFLNAEGIQTSQICQRMKNIYGESCLSQKNIYKWVNEFKNGRITCTDIERPGRPSVTATPSTINAKNIHFYHRQRMNSDLYCDILVNKLKPGIRKKRRGRLSKGVLFLHDNARPHTSCKTVSTIIKLGFEKELKGKRFDSDEDVQKVVQDFFHTLPKSAYKEGIYKLPERWRRCIENQGSSAAYLLAIFVVNSQTSCPSVNIPECQYECQLPPKSESECLTRSHLRRDTTRLYLSSRKT
ncbi:hypothetical protein LAZ67_23000600 [Cordylochernes scorpioides]|uniref:Mos1 transposase HTH domain-containing protein n=1 Tax=Cordylochernes scorpioides TaxID=51811 RepID=A0ABY6LUB5_9ARAC|nr:hypothetical protein LAZ67_23000600 [Cordylochernes scorpioides]